MKLLRMAATIWQLNLVAQRVTSEQIAKPADMVGFFVSKKEDNLFPHPYGYADRKSAEKPFSDMTYEFDPLYIKALVAQQQAEQRTEKRRILLNKIKSAFINFGHKIQSVMHVSFVTDKASLKTAPVHIHKHRHHK